MHGLEQGITQLANYEMNAKVRSNAVSLLNGIIDDLNAAIDVWSNFQKKSNVSSTPGGYGGWAGFSIEKKLFEMDLSARDKARIASGGRSSLDDPIVVLAYNKLGESESVSDRCNSAMNEIRNRIGKVNELIELINSTKPKKAASSATQQSAPKSSAGKKTTAKKKTKSGKPKKKTAKTKAKKQAVKKKAAKKSTKKKAASKKTAKKKTTKKKSASKKPTKKKASKTKTKKKAKRR